MEHSVHALQSDLIVVGAGLAGSAAAWSAAARGLSTVVLEASTPGNKDGSSHGSARIFRRAYDDPLYVRLTGQAGELWRRLEGDAGERLLQVTGGVDFGGPQGTERMHDILAAAGVPAELLDPAAAAERWPGITFDGAGPVMFQPEAGVLDPERAIGAMLRLAVERGAIVLHDTLVTRLETLPGGHGALVRTDQGDFTAPAVVIAVGAWTGPLLSGLIPLPPLTVTQQQVFHFAPRRQLPEPGVVPGHSPWPVLIYVSGPDDIYGLPAGRDGDVPGAIKLGEHRNGTPTTAADRDGVVDPRSRQRLAAFVKNRLPGLDAGPVNETTCLYTSTESEDFILDRYGPFVVTSACSGHGAKFAPLLGEIAIDLVEGKPPPEPRFTVAAHLAQQGRGNRGDR